MIARTNVSIEVEDVNDNAPTCQDTFYTVEVMETFILDGFLILQCCDVDEGNNSMLIYQIQVDSHSIFGLLIRITAANIIGEIFLSYTLYCRRDRPNKTTHPSSMMQHHEYKTH